MRFSAYAWLQVAAVLHASIGSGGCSRPWVDPSRGKCDKFMAAGGGKLPPRPQRIKAAGVGVRALHRAGTGDLRGLSEKWPGKTPCVGHSYVPASVPKRAAEDVVVPLCQGFDSPWNAYVSVTQPRPMSPKPARQQVRAALLLVDSGDSDLMIFPSWGEPSPQR
jgi:hypothetical protein